MTQIRIVTACFIALLLFILYQTILLFSPFFQSLFWAGILSFACFPIYRWFVESLGWTELFAALFITVVVCLVVLPPVSIIVVNLAMQAGGLYQEVVGYVQTGRMEQLVERLQESHLIRGLEQYLYRWEAAKESGMSWVLESLKTLGNYSAKQIGTIMKNLLMFGFNILLTFCLVFVLLKDGRKIYQFLYDVAPLKTSIKKALFDRVNETLEAVIRGQLLTSIVQALLASIIFWLIGVPFPIFFGSLTFLATLLPIVGASIVWVPIVIYLVVQQDFIRAGILFILGFAGISLIDNVLKPLLIGERTKLPYFLLFLGILGGVRIYGLTGIFLAPVVLSLLFSLITIYQKEYLKH